MKCKRYIQLRKRGYRHQCSVCWSNQIYIFRFEEIIEILKGSVTPRDYIPRAERIKDPEIVSPGPPGPVAKPVEIEDPYKPKCFGKREYIVSGTGIDFQECFGCKYYLKCKEAVI